MALWLQLLFSDNLDRYGVYALVFFVLVNACHALVSAHPRRSQEIPVGGMGSSGHGQRSATDTQYAETM